MLLTAPKFPARHGFSTREGGVSEGPFASLNLSRVAGDDLAKVRENERRLAQAAGVTPGQLVTVNQVHGDAIVEVTSTEARDELGPPLADADGLVTRVPGAALCIRTADCVPALVFAPDVMAVAAVHAGWRGAYAEVGAKAVRLLAERYGADPRQMHAVVGPSIRRCCYEVGEDLAAKFEALFGGAVVERGGERPHLDIARACALSFAREGVPPERVETMPECTSCDRRFFSHRRDAGRTGRMISYVLI